MIGSECFFGSRIWGRGQEDSNRASLATQRYSSRICRSERWVADQRRCDSHAARPCLVLATTVPPTRGLVTFPLSDGGRASSSRAHQGDSLVSGRTSCPWVTQAPILYGQHRLSASRNVKDAEMVVICSRLRGIIVGIGQSVTPDHIL